jgi:hypothetical protein
MLVKNRETPFRRFPLPGVLHLVKNRAMTTHSTWPKGEIPQQLRVPARLHIEDVAKILGFRTFDITVLISAKLLKPLGNPGPNSSKYFAAVTILELAHDCEWLDKATRFLAKYWKGRNSRRAKTPTPAEPVLASESDR